MANDGDQYRGKHQKKQVISYIPYNASHNPVKYPCVGHNSEEQDRKDKQNRRGSYTAHPFFDVICHLSRCKAYQKSYQNRQENKYYSRCGLPL